MKAVVTPTFARALKKLFPNQKTEVDRAVELLLKDPFAGEQKVGNLSHVYVYKFKVLDQEWLLAYTQQSTDELKLLTVGSHENFYRLVGKIIK